jgi:hypothetical protein
MTAEQTRKAALAANEKARARKWAYHRSDLAKTGWAPGMLQDDSRELSRWLANQPHARRHVRESCAAIAKATGDTQ